MIPETLYHYTCAHVRELLGDEGVLRPAVDLVPYGRRPLLTPAAMWVWLTDMETPNPGALGLTRHLITCDRTEYRYRVDMAAAGEDIWRWSDVRLRTRPRFRRAMESEYARPSRWFISARPVPVFYDPR
jgi:hypothetical protein